MQSKKLLIPIALLLLIQLSVPICYTFAQDNLVIDHETKEIQRTVWLGRTSVTYIRAAAKHFIRR